MEILIKYGELNTKGENKKYFINLLKKNLRERFEKDRLDVLIISQYMGMYIEFDEEIKDKVLNVLNHTFGIYSYSEIIKTKKDIEEIGKALVEIIRNMAFKTFKVETKRSDKSFPIKSIEISKILGGIILNNYPVKVDVHNPDKIFNIEIKKDFALILGKTYMGLGGYPVGVQKKGLLLLSGGIDSPVAGFLSLKRGIQLDLVYFESLPHTSLEAREKVINLANKLSLYGGDMNLYVVSLTDIQREIYKITKEYGITLLRRMMYRIAERLAIKLKDQAIITGESVGQVASQTLTSLNTINEVTNYLVLRPLASFDKVEVIKIAQKIGTYETSILPYEDCCTIFVPTHPVINPKLIKCYELEEKLEIDMLIDETLENIKKIKIPQEEELSDLLN